MIAKLNVLQDRFHVLRDSLSDGYLEVNSMLAIKLTSMTVSLQSIYATLCWVTGRSEEEPLTQEDRESGYFCTIHEFLFQTEELLGELNECASRQKQKHSKKRR